MPPFEENQRFTEKANLTLVKREAIPFSNEYPALKKHLQDFVKVKTSQLLAQRRNFEAQKIHKERGIILSEIIRRKQTNTLSKLERDRLIKAEEVYKKQHTQSLQEITEKYDALEQEIHNCISETLDIKQIQQILKEENCPVSNIDGCFTLITETQRYTDEYKENSQILENIAVGILGEKNNTEENRQKIVLRLEKELQKYYFNISHHLLLHFSDILFSVLRNISPDFSQKFIETHCPEFKKQQQLEQTEEEKTIQEAHYKRKKTIDVFFNNTRKYIFDHYENKLRNLQKNEKNFEELKETYFFRGMIAKMGIIVNTYDKEKQAMKKENRDLDLSLISQIFTDIGKLSTLENGKEVPVYEITSYHYTDYLSLKSYDNTLPEDYDFLEHSLEIEETVECFSAFQEEFKNIIEKEKMEAETINTDLVASLKEDIRETYEKALSKLPSIKNFFSVFIPTLQTKFPQLFCKDPIEFLLGIGSKNFSLLSDVFKKQCNTCDKTKLPETHKILIEKILFRINLETTIMKYKEKILHIQYPFLTIFKIQETLHDTIFALLSEKEGSPVFFPIKGERKNDTLICEEKNIPLTSSSLQTISELIKFTVFCTVLSQKKSDSFPQDIHEFKQEHIKNFFTLFFLQTEAFHPEEKNIQEKFFQALGNTKNLYSPPKEERSF